MTEESEQAAAIERKRDEDMERAVREMREAEEKRQRSKMEAESRAAEEKVERERISRKADEDMQAGVDEIRNRNARYVQKRENARERQAEMISESKKEDKAREWDAINSSFDTSGVSSQKEQEAHAYNDMQMGGVLHQRAEEEKQARNQKSMLDSFAAEERRKEGEQAHKGFFSGLIFDTKESIRQSRENAHQRKERVSEFFNAPDKGSRILGGLDALALKGYEGGKKHVKASFNDQILVPLQVKDKSGNVAKRSQHPHPIISYGGEMLGTSFTGLSGKGLLRSVESGKSSSFLFGQRKPAAKKLTKKQRAAATRAARVAKKGGGRSLLDDMLFF